MEERILKVLSRIPKDILIHCAEILIFKKRMEAKTEQKWIRFYDPKAEYFEFSNFYKHKKPIVIDGEHYKTTEHYFQAQKYADDIGKNLEYMKLIKDQNTGGQAKMLANPIKKARWAWELKLKELREEYEGGIHFDPVKWNSIREDVMHKALIAKFSQDEHCKKILLSTGDAILCEDTKRDPFWGSGGDPNRVGKLGELLMEVRKSLRT
jgi:N-glycosidase YbiA